MQFDGGSEVLALRFRDECDIMRLSDDELAQRLCDDLPIQGFDYCADPTKTLAYIKFVFASLVMDYKKGSLWEFIWPAEVKVLLEELESVSVEFYFHHKNKSTPEFFDSNFSFYDEARNKRLSGNPHVLSLKLKLQRLSRNRELKFELL